MWLTQGRGAAVYKLHFNVNNSFPFWQGIPHTADTKYTWAEPGGSRGVQYPAVGKLLHTYLSDFIAFGDPNQIIYSSLHVATEHRLEEFREWKGVEITRFSAENFPLCSKMRIRHIEGPEASAQSIN